MKVNLRQKQAQKCNNRAVKCPMVLKGQTGNDEEEMKHIVG